MTLAQEALQTASLNAQLFCKGATAVVLAPKESEALEKAAVKASAADVYGALLLCEALHHGLEPSGEQRHRSNDRHVLFVTPCVRVAVGPLHL